VNIVFVDVQLKSKAKHASYLINGFVYHSFLGIDEKEYLRLPQRYVDHGFKRGRWETPYIRVPSIAVRLRDPT